MKNQEKISEMLNEARESGLTSKQLSEMRHFFKTTTDWHPTKHRTTKEERKTKRKAQKLARRKNR